MPEPPSLRQVQQQLFAQIRGSSDGKLEHMIEGDSRESAAGRIEIYAEMYFLRLRDVLRETFPKLAAVLGDEAFADLAGDYLEAHPSRRPSLRGLGERLPAFLGRRRKGEWPVWAGDLATLEWHRYDVFDAADAPLLTLAAVQRLPASELAGLPIRLAPASRVFRAQHPVEAVWRAVKAGTDTPDPPALATTLLVWRQGTAVYHRPVQPLEVEVLALAAGETTFSLMCEHIAARIENGSGAEPASQPVAQVAFSLLGRWVTDELLVATGP